MKRSAILILFFILGNSKFLNAQDVDSVCSTIMGVEESNTLLDVYPNPTEGTFQIVYGSKSGCPPAGWGGVLIVNITDSKGKTVYSEIINDFEGEYSNTIDLSKEQKGIYILQIAAGKLKLIRREVLR